MQSGSPSLSASDAVGAPPVGTPDHIGLDEATTALRGTAASQGNAAAPLNPLDASWAGEPAPLEIGTTSPSAASLSAHSRAADLHANVNASPIPAKPAPKDPSAPSTGGVALLSVGVSGAPSSPPGSAATGTTTAQVLALSRAGEHGGLPGGTSGGSGGGAGAGGAGLPLSEKISSSGSSNGSGADGEPGAGDKHSLASEHQQLAKPLSPFGTSGAQSGSVLSTPAPLRFAELSAAPGTATSGGLAAGDPSGPDAATRAAAQEAIATISRIADAQAARSDAGAHTVNLGLKVGDEHLSVRVQLQNGQVQTQFRTDSAALRQAISDQWSTLSSPSAQRTVQFAPPQFVGGSGGDAASSRQGRGFGDSSPSSASAALVGALPSSRSARTGSTDAPASAPGTPPPSSRSTLLNALA